MAFSLQDTWVLTSASRKDNRWCAKSIHHTVVELDEALADERVKRLPPADPAFGQDGTIYVADAGNRRIQVFDRQGNFRSQITGIGTPQAISISCGPGGVHVVGSPASFMRPPSGS